MKQHVFATIIIILLGGILYANTLNSPFVFDDAHNITDNPYIRISDVSWKSLYTAGLQSPSYRRPVANISFSLNYLFGKYDVRGYHIVNVAIHILNGILVYFLAGFLFRHVSVNVISPASGVSVSGLPNTSIALMSLFSALIFVAHPVQTQSVTYIVQRMNSLATLFYLSSFLLYLHARLRTKESGHRRKAALSTGCGISWLLALGSKEIAIMLPFSIFLYEWFFFQDLNRDWLLKHVKILLFFVLVSGLIILLFMGGLPFEEISASFAKREFSMGERILTQFRVIILYLSLLLLPLPSRLNLLHSFSTSRSLIEPITTLWALIGILFLIGLAIMLSRKHRLISFCILWFFIHLAIESSVIGLEMVFEHRLYLPMVSVSVLFVFILFHLMRKKIAWISGVCILIVLLLGTGTYLRNHVWRDQISLLSDVVTKNPQSYRAWNNLGYTRGKRGNADSALDHYRQALKIKPDYADAHYNIGVALERQGNPRGAMGYYYKAITVNPGHALAHNNIALLLESQGEITAAMDHYIKALQHRPELAEAHNNLGILLEKQGKLDGAIDHYRNAVRYRADFAEAYNNLGIALTRKGRMKEGIESFFKALQLHPEGKGTCNNLGVALSQLGDFKAAIIYFTEALRIDPDYAEARRNLSIALQRLDASGNPGKARQDSDPG